MVRKHLRNTHRSVQLFVALFVMYALIYMTKNCYSAAMASIVSQGIMTKSQTGLIAAMFYLVYAPFQIVGGVAADRFAPEKLLLGGTLGAAICNLLVYIFAENYVAMLVIWSCNAAIQFGIWPAIFKIITTELHPEHSSRAVFFISFSSSIGLVFSYTCAALITDWKFNFLFSAIVLFVCVVVFFFFYRFIEKSMVVDEAPPVRPPKSDKKEKSAKGMIGLVLTSGVPLLLIVYVIQSLLNLGLKTIIPVMLMESYEAVSPSLASMLNIILVIAGPIGMLISRIPALRRLQEPLAISIIFVVAIPLLLILTWIGNAPLFVILASLVLLMMSLSTMSIFFSFISKAFTVFGCSGTLSGLFNCMASLGIMLANYGVTRLAEATDWRTTTFVLMLSGVLAFVCALVAIPMWRRFSKKVDAMTAAQPSSES